MTAIQDLYSFTLDKIPWQQRSEHKISPNKEAISNLYLLGNGIFLLLLFLFSPQRSVTDYINHTPEHAQLAVVGQLKMDSMFLFKLFFADFFI